MVMIQALLKFQVPGVSDILDAAAFRCWWWLQMLQNFQVLFEVSCPGGEVVGTGDGSRWWWGSRFW